MKKPEFPPNRLVDDGGDLYYLMLPIPCFIIPVILLISLL